MIAVFHELRHRERMAEEATLWFRTSCWKYQEVTSAEFRGDLSARNARGNAPRNGNISEGEIKKAGNPREIRSPGYYSDSASLAVRETFGGMRKWTLKVEK